MTDEHQSAVLDEQVRKEASTISSRTSATLSFPKKFNLRKRAAEIRMKGRRKPRKKKSSQKSGETDAAMMRELTEKLARQLLKRDKAATQAEAKVAELTEQVKDLLAWQNTARIFAQRSADKKKLVDEQFAARDRELVLREKRVAAREKELDERNALLATCKALERELRAEKSRAKRKLATTTETERRSARREEELRFAKDELHRLERGFVGHLQHMLEVQNDVLAKISDDADVGATQRASEVSREMLKSRLAVACASEGAEKGTGLSNIANELVESLKATYGKSSDKAEELRTARAQLTEQVSELSSALETVTAEKVHLTQKLRSEQVGSRK